jgi:hypothetical protein
VSFRSREDDFAPDVSEYWQAGRIPTSPLRPRTAFTQWLFSDSEENYRTRGNRQIPAESVDYRFNSFGYRSPEFDREPGERLVAFLGDSNTFGMGTPWESVWTSVVTAYLADRWGVPVRQCNLAWSGTGSDYVAMMVHQCVDILRPDAVFVLWSYVERATWFETARRQVFFSPNWLPKEKEAHEAYLRLATDAQGFFNYVRNFSLVDQRLANMRIPYFWGNIERFSEQLLGSYLPMNGFVGRWERADLARDGSHGGPKSHGTFASLVMQALERSGIDGDRGPSRMNRIPEGRLVASPDYRDRSGAFRALVPLERVMGGVRLRRRVRAMKRRDPFIY